MKELKNELTWSISRGQLFQECPRAYYYNYYASWGGWKQDAPDQAKLAYLLKNLQRLVLWAGSIVHETIKDALSLTAATGERIPLAKLQENAVIKMRNGWREALDKKWLVSPKRTNIFELYYGDGENYGECRHLPRETTDAIKQRVLDCMEGFFYSPAVKEIHQTPPSQWQPIDTLDSFELDGIKVWCAPDFAFQDAEGVFHILDWKTGEENVRTISQQLACYALFAMNKWNVSLERIRIQGVFLKDGGRVRTYDLNQESIDTVTKQIHDSYNAMREKLTDADANVAEEENFPRRLLESRCANCQFRRICLQG